MTTKKSGKYILRGKNAGRKRSESPTKQNKLLKMFMAAK